ncbi:AlpA family transcriptional regulator [Luteibacter rhizovicinus]|uniref:AlpA family transcriptional regulator n=1 Tax=Luteibacter rhizovicinus TaxID=242606 RepID=UPI00104AE208|nr:AlpA family transcriptional regulator [Luteibacter rhizovicinus]
MPDQTKQHRFLRIRHVLEKVGLSRAQIYKLMGLSEFPKQINLGGRSVAWLEQDIDLWMAERHHASRQPKADALRKKWEEGLRKISLATPASQAVRLT